MTNAPSPSADREQRPVAAPADGKRTYHHGDLREALILAAFEIVCEKGAEKFTVSDACRMAGVSTAAPYKHFRDRTEILACVAQRGFTDLADRGVNAAQAAGEGTLEGIIALNRAYVEFALEQQSLFRLMFGQHPELKQQDAVLDCGRDCFERVVQQFELYCTNTGTAEDATTVCLRLWTFVHGMASLVLDEDYEAVAPGLDWRTLLETTAPKLLDAQSE